MRIVILTNSLSSGGAERSMNLLSNALMQSGKQVLLVPINSSKEDAVNLIAEIWSPDRERRSGLIQTISALVSMWRFIAKWNPDVLILNCDISELLGTFIQIRKPKIVVEHAPYPWNTRKTLGKFIRFLLRVQKSTFIAVSTSLKIWPNEDEPTAVIPNLIMKSGLPGNDSNYTENMQILGLSFIGRFSEEKNPSLALKIASESKLPIRFFGEGLLNKEIVEESRALSVQTELLGFRKTVWDEILDGELIIIPSLWEGDGLVVVEALEHRKPILLADIPAFRRFALPEYFYCKSKADFVSAIKANRHDISTFIPSLEKRNQILATRDSLRIIGLWDLQLFQLVSGQSSN